jgi:hypothetical protein
MAKKRYDVAVGIKGKDDKTYWKQIGVVLQNEKGFSLKLESIPVGWDGWASLFEPKAKEPTSKPAQAPATKAIQDLDDDIPF